MKRPIILLAVMALCLVSTASAQPVVSVTPQVVNAELGDVFTIDIIVDPMGDGIYAAQYNLYFDNSILNATAQTQGTFLSHDGASTTNMPNRFNNTIGLIEYGETRRNVEYGVTTSGILAAIKFNATKHGVCSLTLRDVVMSDQNGDGIPDVSSNDGRCIITSIETGTPTATEPPSSGMVIPTATGSPTPAPTEPAATPTATTVETAAADQTPPTEPQSTASSSATLKQTVKRPSDNSISGFTSILAMIGLLIALYAISKGKR